MIARLIAISSASEKSSARPTDGLMVLRRSMVSDINIKKLSASGSDDVKADSKKPQTTKNAAKRSHRRNRRVGPRRSIFTSRLTRAIFLSNLIGLIILIFGALTMHRVQDVQRLC